MFNKTIIIKRWLAGVVCVCATAGGFSAEVGVYNPSLDGGKSVGELATKTTLVSAGIEADEFDRMSMDNLLKYRVVIIPNTKALAQNEDERWSDNLRAYVTECGGAIVFCHDAIGAKRSPFGKLPLFPEIVVPGSVERSATSNAEVALPEDTDYEFLPGYSAGQVAEHMYSDHFMFETAGGIPILSDVESGKVVVVAGTVGKGRVVFNGMFGGHPTGLAGALDGLDRDVMVNAVQWCLAGAGLAITDPSAVKVAEWRPKVEDAAKSGYKVAVIGDSGYDINYRARTKIAWCGLKHDFIPVHMLALRDLSRDDYRLVIIFLPLAWEEAKVSDAAFEKIDNYIKSGGKAIMFLPVSIGRKTTQYFLQPFGIDRAKNIVRFNPDELRMVKWTDSDGNTQQNEYIPHNNLITYITPPTAADAEVIGYWFDYRGEQKSPAIIRMPFGYIASINIFGDHRLFTANAAVELMPEIGSDVFQHLLWTYHQTREQMGAIAFSESGQALSDRAEKLREQAVGAARDEKITAANRLILEAEAELVKAYAVSMPSPTNEERMVSLHVHALPDPEITCARLAKAGFNGIHLFGIDGNYPSELYNRSDAADQTDWMQTWIDTAHKHGLKIGPVITFSRIYSGADISERAIAEDWRVVPLGMVGKPVKPLEQGASLRRIQICRTHPELADYAARRMLEIIEKYPVDYVIYDYIRWSEPCYCDTCRREFQKATGLKIENWPTDATEKYRDEYNQWRASPITGIIRTASENVAKVNPKIKIGAYIKEFIIRDGRPFSGLGQHWWEWTDYVDYLMPMSTYVPDLQKNEELFKNITSLLPAGSRARLCPAMAPPGAKGGSDLLRLQQIELMRKYGGVGNAYFWYHGLPDAYLELLEIGPWRNRPTGGDA